MRGCRAAFAVQMPITLRDQTEFVCEKEKRKKKRRMPFAFEVVEIRLYTFGRRLFSDDESSSRSKTHKQSAFASE